MSARPAWCAGCGAALAPSDGARPRKWCSERCRKASYAFQACMDCGQPTSRGPANGYVAEPRCPTCSCAHRKIWTPAAVLQAIREWAAIHGEPPALPDWDPWRARHVLHDDARARRFEDAQRRWPSFKVVCTEFGSWNAAIEAAGFEPRAATGGRGNAARRRAKAAA